jgi:predicted MFS family arabinose efflux permease
MADLGIGYSEVGMLLGAYMLPGVVVAYPAGLLGSRGREKTLGIAGLLLMAVSGLALSYSGDLTSALIARIVGGVGGAVVGLVATKLVADWFESSEIVLAMSVLQMSWPFGAMVALPIQALIGQSFGWHGVMASAAICSVAVLIAFAMIPRAAQLAQAATTAGSGRLARAALAPVIISGVIWGAMNLAGVLFFTYAPPLMVAQGSTPTVAASLTSLAIWFIILAIPAGGYLVNRAGRPLTAIIACSLIGAASLLLFVANFHPTISCLIFGLSIGPMSGAILSMPTRVLEPADRSVGFGLFYTCFYVLLAAGPLVAGRLQDAFGSPSAALVAGAALLVSMVPLVALFWSVLKRREFAAAGHEAKLRAVS